MSLEELLKKCILEASEKCGGLRGLFSGDKKEAIEQMKKQLDSKKVLSK